MMHEVTVRNADTGHSHLFPNVDSYEVLRQIIEREMKVEITDQVIISKSGHRMKANSTFNN